MGYQRRVHGDSWTEASPDESAGKIVKMGDSKKLGFLENFMLAGVAAGVSKTVAAPIERIKLLVQNQDEMIRQGRLDKPYAGVIDCTKRVLATEGVVPLWRGNLANVLRYFPTQALRHPEANADWRKGRFRGCFLPSGLGSHCYCWSDVLPQVQGFHRLRHTSLEERRLHEPDEG